MGRITKDDVKAALDGRVLELLERFGQSPRDKAEIRLAECPVCHDGTRRASFMVDRETGDFLHHANGCKGDVLALIAAYADLDVRSKDEHRGFPAVLRLGAQIAGLSDDADDAELARIREETRLRREVRERRIAQEQAEAEALVPRLWDAARRDHVDRGEPYLDQRLGLAAAAELMARGAVRFRPSDGSPCVQINGFDSGEPINIATRQAGAAGDAKVMTLDIKRTLARRDVIATHSTLGSLVGRVHEVDRDGLDVAVLTEGVMDTLAAVLAFPSCAVVGANGWFRMEHVAAAVAPRVKDAGGVLLVVAHDDEQGECGGARALQVAIAAGLVVDESVLVVDIAPHKDLADAWRAGWRWQWPEPRTS